MYIFMIHLYYPLEKLQTIALPNTVVLILVILRKYNSTRKSGYNTYRGFT